MAFGFEKTKVRICVVCSILIVALAIPLTARAGQTLNTTSTTSCTAQSGVPSGVNLVTDFDNGTFGSEDGSPDQSPNTDPYPAQITGGTYDNFYSINWGDYSYVANPVTPRNPFQHPEITDPVYGVTGRFFASDPNTDTPTLNFTITNITPNENYELSFWAANSEPSGIPNIVNAILDGVASYSTGPLPAISAALEWRLHAFVFNAGDRTSVQLSMQSTETGSGGRDFYVDNIVMQGCTLTGGAISGTVFTDSNGDDVYTVGTDGTLANIAVQLWDTQGDADASNDIYVSTTTSGTSGFYEFQNLPASTTYELRVDTTDTDLPAGSSPGTPVAILTTVTSGGVITGENFGFDLSNALLESEKTVAVYDPVPSGFYATPGNDVVYTITTINRGGSSADTDSIFIVDTLPPELTFYNDDMDDGGTTTTDPVAFSQSGAALSFTYGSDVGFAASGPKPANFSACTYTPTITGYDENIAYVCFNPTGAMAAGTPDPSFSVSFRARIK